VRVIEIPFGMLIGFLLWFFLRYGFGGFYTVGPSERAVLTSLGRASRIPGQTTLNDPVSAIRGPTWCRRSRSTIYAVTFAT
jgi:hypothetical protein